MDEQVLRNLVIKLWQTLCDTEGTLDILPALYPEEKDKAIKRCLAKVKGVVEKAQPEVEEFLTGSTKGRRQELTEVKIQMPLSGDKSLALVQDKSQTFIAHVPVGVVKHLFTNGRNKIYCLAKLPENTDTVIKFIQEVTGAGW